MRHLIIACLMGFMLTGAASADIVATYKYQGGETMTLSVKDSSHVRMESSSDSYMLIQENKVYSVNRDENGQWMVMDMDQMKAMASGGLTGLFNGQATKKNSSATYEKTGKTEKIAGYTGSVYTATLLENGQVTRQDQVVLCTHPDIQELNQGWSAIGSKMGQIMGSEMSQGVEEIIQSGYGGMLRYGNEMRLDSLKKISLAPFHYQLPPGAQRIEMGQMPNSKSGQEEDQASDSQDQEPSALEQDAKDVGQAARDEAKDSTIEEVREGVQGLFKSIFN